MRASIFAGHSVLPGRGIPFDWYSARWRSTLTTPASGVKRIAVEGNDGYRLFIDDVLVIDNWRKQSHARAPWMSPGRRDRRMR